MQDFPGGGATLFFGGIWIYVHAAKLRAVARGVWRHAPPPPPPPKKIFKNGTISCVLRAIFNHFHDKKFSQKFMNKQEFFH